MPPVSFPARHKRLAGYIPQAAPGAHCPVGDGGRKDALGLCPVARCSVDVSHLSTYEFLGRMDLISAKGFRVCYSIMSTFLY